MDSPGTRGVLCQTVDSPGTGLCQWIHLGLGVDYVSGFTWDWGCIMSNSGFTWDWGWIMSVDSPGTWGGLCQTVDSPGTGGGLCQTMDSPWTGG